ncbi:MAG: indole-3-glycerol phosphate synthase TrpC [Bacteroidetes bacterium]|nr:indole-3-glycerol phosphate synthase TrpC [Bacteroidota bacterium]MBS1633847.1 indole-3-glycerol phosphate synthase TrpC [Bacteroidota bacterium]
MNILDKIIDAKRKSVKQQKSDASIHELMNSVYFKRNSLSLVERLNSGVANGIIAEFKRKSPSKGIINNQSGVVDVVSSYEKYGASGISVLTDEEFFGGSSEDLKEAREAVSIPILRKDFIIDEYQLIEAKAIGADVILLIAACLSPGEVRRLAAIAKNLGLEILLELHDEKELDHICDETKIIGINNRNLKTFEVDIEKSLKMAEKIPGDKIKIAESGINSAENIRLFKENGFKGFLIGENFMKEANPGKAFEKFVNKLK